SGIPCVLRDAGARAACICRLPRDEYGTASAHRMPHQETTADMKRAKYEKTLEKLQVRLCHLQRYVKEKGLRVVIVMEGRDGAGKGGTIRAITERLSPRVFRVVALPAPSDRQKTQVYMQRYIEQFPARGEVVIFDRSWYNRAGVEYVMGFCTKE